MRTAYPSSNGFLTPSNKVMMPFSAEEIYLMKTSTGSSPFLSRTSNCSPKSFTILQAKPWQSALINFTLFYLHILLILICSSKDSSVAKTIEYGLIKAESIISYLTVYILT